MNDHAKSSLIDILLGAIFIVFGGVVYFLTLDLPGPIYDPLGPAFMPRALAVCSILCSVVILFHGIRKRMRMVKEGRGEEKHAVSDNLVPFMRHPLTAAAGMLLVFMYILALDLGLSGFKTLTIVFVLVLGGILIKAEHKGSPAKKAVVLVLLALFMGFGMFYLFTRVFFVDLY